MGVRAIDLNLLRVFEAVMRNRSASGAAKELGVTSSAVSHALARLRRVLKDELFVTGPRGLEPTPLALEIAPEINGGMDRIFEGLERKPFVPGEMARTFGIGMSDYTATLLLAKLIADVTKTAPLVDFRVFPLGRMDVVRSLDEGRVDFVLTWFGEVPPRLKRAHVLTEEEALVVRDGHPLTSGVVTRERLFEYPYVVVELTGTEDKGWSGYIDERQVVRRNWMERLLVETHGGESNGMVGRVAVTVPYYAAVGPILQQTDMVATLPRSLAETIAQQNSLTILDLPYEPLKVSVDVIWHQRSERDRGFLWVISKIFESARDLAK